MSTHSIEEDKQKTLADTQHVELQYMPPQQVMVPVTAFAHLTQRQTLKVFWKSSAFALMVLFAACSDGYQLTLPGNLIAEKSFIAQFATLRTAAGAPALNAKIVGGWAGAYQGAVILTLLVGGFPADWFGRRFNVALLNLFMVAATLVEIFARSWQTWMLAKIFNGFSIGLAQLTLTSYVSEIAAPQVRGLLLVGYALFFAFGQFLCAIATYIIQAMPTQPRLYLRLVYSEFVFSGVVFVVVLFMPESPRWLIRRGKFDKAAAVLRRINGAIPGYNVDHELLVMQHEIEQDDTKSRTSYWLLFKGVNLRRTMVSFSIMGWQQCIGIPIVFGYSAVFFRLAGLKNPFLGTIIVQLLLLFFTATSGFMVDRFGRRPLLLTGGLFMVGALVIIGGLSFPKISSGISVGMTTLMMVWVVAYALSAGPCGYLVLGETPTALLRAKTAGVAAGMSNCFGLIFNYCTPLMLLTEGGLGWGTRTALLFAGLGFIGLVLIFFFVPEQRGRSFTELDWLYEHHVPARKFRKTQVPTTEESRPEMQGV